MGPASTTAEAGGGPVCSSVVVSRRHRNTNPSAGEKKLFLTVVNQISDVTKVSMFSRDSYCPLAFVKIRESIAESIPTSAVYLNLNQSKNNLCQQLL
jgi:hypothetical protein